MGIFMVDGIWQFRSSLSRAKDVAGRGKPVLTAMNRDGKNE
jgi:hypothetical protein